MLSLLQVSWMVNFTLQDTARHGYNKLFAYRGATVTSNKLLTICKTLTWCEAVLCFRLLSATAAEGKQRRLNAMSFSTSRKLKGPHCAIVTLPKFSNNNLCLFSVHETNEKMSIVCFSCWHQILSSFFLHFSKLFGKTKSSMYDIIEGINTCPRLVGNPLLHF